MAEYSLVDEPLTEDLAALTPTKRPKVVSLHGPGQEDLQPVGCMYRNPQTGVMWAWTGKRWVIA